MIPLKKGVTKSKAEEADKALRRHRAALSDQTGTTKDIRRLLQKALLHAIQADNGHAASRDKMLVCLDIAIERGMLSDAITDGPGMCGKISALLDRGESLDHCCGLLYEVVDMLTEAGRVEDAQAARSIAESINTPANVEAWRGVSRPRVVEIKEIRYPLPKTGLKHDN